MSRDLVFADIPKIVLSSFHPATLSFPEMKANRQREWEFWVTKLHGADLAASDEDLQTIKNLVNKLGR